MDNNLPKFIPFDLGVASDSKKVYIYGNLLNFSENSLFTSVSLNGTGFKSTKKKAEISTQTGNLNTSNLKDFRISKQGKEFYLAYKSLAQNT